MRSIVVCPVFIYLLFLFASCNNRFNNGQHCYRKTKTITTAVSVSKFWNEYLRLREDGYFKHYMKFLGMNITLDKGTYSIQSDSIILNTCDEKTLLNGKGIIDKSRKQIILYTKDSTRSVQFYIKDEKKQFEQTR